ncbi:lactonase family protein [Pedobacter frigoris]|uniref:lactonase family protein n=1 Tax=Pedobacter frigoris TaxID=2571272 RepID=UPI00292EDA33|nr:lactonase family protein [Pedobacter frigoris]
MKRTFLLPLILLAMQSCAQKTDLNLVVGTYTKPGGSEGIYVYNFNTATGDFKQKGLAKGVENPSYLAVSADNKFVYSVNESGKASSVSAFAFGGIKGDLKFLNKQPSGEDPCYIISDGKHVISANYSGGNISVFGIKPDGSLSALKQTIQHSGKSINKDRQNSPHVHMVQFTPDHKFVVVNDLGTDKVYLYKYNASAAADVLTPQDSVAVEAGSGPRHIVFSNDGRYAYLINEMFASITVFSYNDGSLEQMQETKITADGFNGENGAADIHISPDGKFLYASNRGSENKITIFAIEKGGLLSRRGMVSTGGKGPRNFIIDPTGKYLLVGHQYDNNIVIFERDASSGALKDTGKRINVGSPVCLAFAQVK